ncbi:serine/threonine protein kinase [Kitasatospora sp. NBC_00240]|uniref:serine/threonine-protein kinase n=1 Tax=Kitasatospora sp. NBC_00240 TaxID=2903567 RepID=UPI00224D0CF7|nr:serine/threonine-protein kinase [Kitasatospora sp. NBC_00240]MCX5215284.1 serine/threonine protein kinase [Kitasatospora sp. NBC_00240]
MTTANASSTPVGLFANRYRVQGHLGSGGAAEVVRAVDERLERPVALKVFRAGAGAEAAERFALEGRTLARLRHPGLVQVYDYGHWDERPFLVLELIEGPTLRDVLRREPLSPSAAARLGTRLANTLSFVHGHGIVHRDVKPANILIGAGGAPRLADFGVARLTGDAAVTRTGFVVGTPAYLAPEQIRGRQAQPAADVYALGLVLLECLTGRREYGGAPLEAAAARLHRAPAVPGGLPALLRQVLRRMTLTDPRQRPSAIECAEVLGEVMSAAGAVRTQALHLPAPLVRPEPPHPTSAPAAPPTPARRRRGVSLAAATVLGLAALAGGSTLGAAPPAVTPAPAAPAGGPDPAGSTSTPRADVPAAGVPAAAPSAGTAPATDTSGSALPSAPTAGSGPATHAPSKNNANGNGNGNQTTPVKAKRKH